MEPFVTTFFAIDKNHTETITTDELYDYVKTNHLDSGMVQRWKDLFDPERTGRITFHKFCDVLGIQPERARVMKTGAQNVSAAPGLGSDITIICQELSIADQIRITDYTRSIAKPKGKISEREVSQKLKTWLDSTYGPSWHVTIVKGSYWTTYTHTPNQSIHFRLDDYSYVVWRTPL